MNLETFLEKSSSHDEVNFKGSELTYSVQIQSLIMVNYCTTVTGLDGVPFALGPRVRISPDSILAGKSSGRFRPKTAQEIEAQMNYSFFTELSALLRL